MAKAGTSSGQEVSPSALSREPCTVVVVWEEVGASTQFLHSSPQFSSSPESHLPPHFFSSLLLHLSPSLTDPPLSFLSFFQASGMLATFGIFDLTTLLRDLGQPDASSFSSSFWSLCFLLFSLLSLLPQTDCTSFSSPQDSISRVPKIAQLPSVSFLLLK